MERSVSTDLPRESARWAWIAALRFQVALRLSRLDLEVFFFGTAMSVVRVGGYSFASLMHFCTDLEADLQMAALEMLKALVSKHRFCFRAVRRSQQADRVRACIWACSSADSDAELSLGQLLRYFRWQTQD